MQVDINPKHDPKKLAKEFARRGRLQIRDFFTGEYAEGLWKTITEKTPWAFTFIADGDVHVMSGPEFSAMLERRRRELWSEIYNARAMRRNISISSSPSCRTRKSPTARWRISTASANG